MKKKNFLTIFLIIFSLAIVSILNAINIQKDLASKVIRLHVIANSDSKLDQEIKLKVRDEIIKELSPALIKSNSIGESRNIILNNIKKIKKISENYSDKKVTVCLDHSNFPTKEYEGISFPAGNYEALKITIGEGKGKNWWCVMFPPLCFTNSSISFSENSVKTLKQNLTNEEYELISTHSPKIKFKFKILELINH